MEMDKIKDYGKIERETNLNRRGPSQIGTEWHIPDPPTFSLPTTFKSWLIQMKPIQLFFYTKMMIL